MRFQKIWRFVAVAALSILVCTPYGSAEEGYYYVGEAGGNGYGEERSYSDRSYIVSPENDRLYYASRIMVYLQGNLTEGVEVFLDDQPLESTRVQWISPQDGLHTVSVVLNGTVAEKSEFEVRTESVSRYTSKQFETLPSKFEVPAAGGSMTPIYYRLANVGKAPITNLFMRSQDQPDLHNSDDIRDFVLRNTNAMSDDETIKFLFNWLSRQLIWAGGYFYDSEGLDLPGAFTVSGYGMCGEHADNLASLAVMAGFPVESIRRVSLPEHEVVEFYYDGGWHMFDASSIVYYEGPQGVLSCEDIAAAGSELIMDYTDQFGASMSGNLVEQFIDDYSDPDNFIYYEFSFQTGRPTTWTLAPGDVLEIFVRGFGLTHLNLADGIPLANTTAVLTRTVERPRRNEPIDIDLPYDLRSVRYKLDSNGASGSAEVQFNAVGDRAIVSQIVTVPTDGAWHDLTALIPSDTIGLTTHVSLRNLSTTAPVNRATVEVGFPFAPRALPQITPEVRQLFIEGNGGYLDFSMEVFDVVLPVRYAILNTPESKDTGKVLAVRNDGKDWVSLYAEIADASNELASGHKLAVTSDHPDEIETGPLSRRGYWGNESVLSTWAGPSRWTWLDNFQFYAKSRAAIDTDIGPVVFTLWVDGQAAATTTVNFVVDPDDPVIPGDDDNDDDESDDDAGDDDIDEGDDDSTPDAPEGEDSDAEAAGCGC